MITETVAPLPEHATVSERIQMQVYSDENESVTTLGTAESSDKDANNGTEANPLDEFIQELRDAATSDEPFAMVRFYEVWAGTVAKYGPAYVHELATLAKSKVPAFNVPVFKAEVKKVRQQYASVMAEIAQREHGSEQNRRVEVIETLPDAPCGSGSVPPAAWDLGPDGVSRVTGKGQLSFRQFR